jgi:multiple antibiotic resistance protein
MIEIILPLIVLFMVIIDPPLSFAFFIANTSNISKKEKIKIATLTMTIAFIISYLFLFFGEFLLNLFSLELNDLKIAGGIILGILGTNMALGLTVKRNLENKNNPDKHKALASIIATPLISGPACITTIIISSIEYGTIITGIALSTVLIITALLLFISVHIKKKHLGDTAIKVFTTIMGLITLTFGVEFIRAGIGF